MDDGTCPLCTEELDPTDYLLASRLCHCRFSVCLWCFRRITEDAAKDSRPALCPNCREPYDIERITREGRELNPQQLEEVKRKKVKPEDRKKAAAAVRSRRDLANVRVVQRNLVYVVGLPLEVCYEDLLLSTEHVGQFGKIVKISVSRSGPYGSLAAKNGPTGSAYITFKRAEDARRCIENMHGTMWEGKLVKACYGTTKYCNAFLKGLPCNNAECLYLHDVASEEDSYTKEETKSTKFVNLVHAASLNQASAVANGQPHSTATPGELSTAISGVLHGQNHAGEHEGHAGAEEESASHSLTSLQNNAWAAKVSPLPPKAVPPSEDPQAWPGLPGNRTNGLGNLSSAEVSENESEQAGSRLPVTKSGDKLVAENMPPSAAAQPNFLDSMRKEVDMPNGSSKTNKGQHIPADAHHHKGLRDELTAQTNGQLEHIQQESIRGHHGPKEGGVVQFPDGPNLIHAAASNREEGLASSSAKAPPGFANLLASKPKMGNPPPGFAQQLPVSQLGPSYFPASSEEVPLVHNTSAGGGSRLSEHLHVPNSRDSHGPVQQLSAPHGYDWQIRPQPRSRSRYHFANSEDSMAGRAHSERQEATLEQSAATARPKMNGDASLGQAVLGGLSSQSPYNAGPDAIAQQDLLAYATLKPIEYTTPSSQQQNEATHSSQADYKALSSGLLLLQRLRANSSVAQTGGQCGP